MCFDLDNDDINGGGSNDDVNGLFRGNIAFVVVHKK